MIDVFKNWREEQDVYSAVSISSVKKLLEKRYINRFRKFFLRELSDLQTLTGFFEPKLGCLLESYEIPDVKSFSDQFDKLYSFLDGDIEKFVLFLKESGFSSDRLEKTELKFHIDVVVKKYVDLFEHLFDFLDDDKKGEFLFAVANKFFEYCFSEYTFKQFKKMLQDESYYSIIRMFYSIIWTNLSEVGWQHWHASAIAQLKEASIAGKEIVYIAGGTDIYQMLSNGIYNIRVIDPLLSSQPKYYSQHWDWFIAGEGDDYGVGERVTVSCGNKKIIMERTAYEETGKSFTIHLSSKKKEVIKESVTTWSLFDMKKKLLGTVCFERRLAHQADFSFDSNRVLLISFNELYFVASPKNQSGWGIDPDKFDDLQYLIVKQLAKPVGKQVVCNMRQEVQQSDFSFINLGTCVD